MLEQAQAATAAVQPGHSGWLPVQTMVYSTPAASSASRARRAERSSSGEVDWFMPPNVSEACDKNSPSWL